MRVLVVDDEPLLVKSVKRVLVREGHEVVTAGHGAEALDVLGTTSVDIVLSDVRMPVMDGVEFVRRLSGMAQAPPVVLLTGYADVSDAELRAGGVIAVLGKPVEVAALMETLRRCCRK
jgi:CheY-like chemotaxis protein